MNLILERLTEDLRNENFYNYVTVSIETQGLNVISTVHRNDINVNDAEIKIESEDLTISVFDNDYFNCQRTNDDEYILNDGNIELRIQLFMRMGGR